jgi:hypothetical protein
MLVFFWPYSESDAVSSLRMAVSAFEMAHSWDAQNEANLIRSKAMFSRRRDFLNFHFPERDG